MKRKFAHKKLITAFCEKLTKSASSCTEDESNVAFDLLMLSFECLPDNMIQKVLDQISYEYKVEAPKIFIDDELPF